MAFIGTGAAMHASVQINFKRAIFIQQIAHFGDSLVVPIFHKFAGKADRLLDWRLRDKRLAMGHCVLLQDRDDRIGFYLGYVKLSNCHNIPLNDYFRSAAHAGAG